MADTPVTYVGHNEEANIYDADHDFTLGGVKRGATVDVPPEVAKKLLDSDAWEKPDAKRKRGTDEGNG